MKIPILDNPQASVNETVQLVASDPSSGAALGSLSMATLTIHPVKAVVQFGAGKFAANVRNGKATISLARSGILPANVTVIVSSFTA